MSELVFPVEKLQHELADTTLASWAQALGSAVTSQEHALKHGHLPRWEEAVAMLPAATDISVDIVNGALTISGNFSDATSAPLKNALELLAPWRKGPYQFGPHFVDTEWRSDWKWNRIAPHIQPLENRTVLDVGCGSGYHMWRMRHAGAKLVLGIDPSLLYLKQFEAVQKYLQDTAVQFLPLPMEALPSPMQVFDTVFSMGVLYHRRDPISHLHELINSLTPGGELVLETLVISAQEDTSLELTGRYANMRNIYELPSQLRLESWLRSAGLCNIRTVSVDVTSRSEQRSTHWMPSHSLEQALDVTDRQKTIEGHPRPMRAVVLATRHQ